MAIMKPDTTSLPNTPFFLQREEVLAGQKKLTEYYNKTDKMFTIASFESCRAKNDWDFSQSKLHTEFDKNRKSKKNYINTTSTKKQSFFDQWRRTEVIPDSLKQVFFSKRSMPDLSSYDSIGFDTDCLLKFDRKALTKHIVKQMLSSLVERFHYPREILKLDDEHLSLTLDGAVWDIKTGMLLKLAEHKGLASTPRPNQSVITEALYGFDRVTDGFIKSIYGARPSFTKLKWPHTSCFLEEREQAHWVLVGFPEQCLAPVICSLVRNRRAKDKDCLQMAMDLREVYTSYMSLHEVKCMSDYQKESLQFVVRQPELRTVISGLRSHGKLFLTSDESLEYVKRAMSLSLDHEWLDLFDLCIVEARKPLFQQAENPFFAKVNKEVTRISTVAELGRFVKNPDHKVLHRGNMSLLTEYFRQNLVMKRVEPDIYLAYFGSHYLKHVQATYDFAHQKKKYDPVKAHWDVIAVIPEFATPDQKGWAQSFFCLRDPIRLRNFFLTEVEKQARYAVGMTIDIREMFTPTVQKMQRLRKKGFMNQSFFDRATGLMDQLDSLLPGDISIPQCPINVDHEDAKADLTKKLGQALEQTLITDAETRNLATSFILDSQKLPIILQCLLDLSVEESLTEAIQTAAAVQLGALIERHWRYMSAGQAAELLRKQMERSEVGDGHEPIIFSQADKEYVRMKIVKFYYGTDVKPVQRQYGRIVTSIAFYDYPEKWPQLMEDIVACLKGQDIKGLFTGLMCLVSLVQKYRFEIDEANRQSLYTTLSSVLGILGSLVQNATEKAPLGDEASWNILHLVSKIMYEANQVKVWPHFKENMDNLRPWMHMFKYILDMPVKARWAKPTEETSEIETLDGSILWRAKAKASLTALHFFSGFGWSQYLHAIKDDHQAVHEAGYVPWDQKFGARVTQEFAPGFMESFVELFQTSMELFVGTKTLSFTLKFFEWIIVSEISASLLTPHLNTTFYKCLIKILMLTQSDMDLFRDDPVEYERRGFDHIEIINNPRQIAVSLIRQLGQAQVRPRYKQTSSDFILPFLTYCLDRIEDFSKMSPSEQLVYEREKEALLAAIGCMHGEIKLYFETQKMMEKVLQDHVLPCLLGSSTFLRKRACWLYGVFDFIKLSNSSHAQRAVREVYMSMAHPDLPVKHEAALTVSSLVRNNKEAQGFLRPALGNILELYLRIMEEIDSEELVDAFSTMVDAFGQDAAPFALDTVSKLTDHHLRLVASDNSNQQQRDESTLTAKRCLVAMGHLVNVCTSLPSLLAKMATHLHPVLKHSLNIDFENSFDEATSIVATLVYHDQSGKPLSKDMWALYYDIASLVVGDLDYDSCGGPAVEYMSQAVGVMQTFIGRDPEGLMRQYEDTSVPEILYFDDQEPAVNRNKTFLKLTETFIERAQSLNIKVTDISDHHFSDGINAMKIIVALLENLNCDNILFNLINKLMEEIDVLHKVWPPQAFRSLLFQSLSLTFLNNANIAVGIFETQDYMDQVFNVLIGHLDLLTTREEMKRVILGMSQLLAGKMPVSLKDRLPEFGKSLVGLTERMGSMRNDNIFSAEMRLKKQLEAEKANEDYESTDEEILQPGGGDRKETEYDFEAASSILYRSRIDQMDELIMLRESLKKMEQESPGLVKLMFSRVSRDQMDSLQKLFSKVEDLSKREFKFKEKLVKKKVTLSKGDAVYRPYLL